MFKKLFKVAAAAVCVCALPAAFAAPLIYSNNAGSPAVQAFDSVTGVRASNLPGSGGNGRGIVVVGNVYYTTNANNGIVVKHNLADGSVISSCNIAAAAGGISTIGYDGDNFWTSDYTGNRAFKIDQNCNLLKTVTLSRSQTGYDGLEFFNNKLIANEFDGGFTGANRYSVYDLDGNLLVADFISTAGHGNGTGIAFDGTDFYIADIFNSQVTKWSGTTGAYISSLTLLNTNNLIEDLSWDYEARVDTCRVNCTVPEPGSLPMALLALAGAGALVRRRKSA